MRFQTTRPVVSLVAFVIAGFVGISIAGTAGAEPPPPRNWELGIIGYGWAPKLSAEFDRELDSEFEVDRSIGDAFWDELGAGLLVHGRVSRFVGIFDGAWNQASDEERLGSLELESDFDVYTLDAKIGARVFDIDAPWQTQGWGPPRFAIDVLGGARYWNANNDVDVDRSFRSDFHESSDWIDPLVGARFVVGLAQSFDVSVIGDVGGFDIGNSSELTWMVMPMFSWRPIQNFGVHAGYKHVEADRERPRLDNHQDWHLSGPFLGLGLHF